jgi:hypothetical protein
MVVWNVSHIRIGKRHYHCLLLLNPSCCFKFFKRAYSVWHSNHWMPSAFLRDHFGNQLLLSLFACNDSDLVSTQHNGLLFLIELVLIDLDPHV